MWIFLRCKALGVIMSMVFVLVMGIPSWATLECGDIIGPNEVATLQHDLSCSGSGPPALTLEAGSILNLGGHTVDCVSQQRHGIIINGHGVILQDGVVMRCSRGVRILGTGGHIINKVKVMEMNNFAFEIRSDNNLLTHNTSRNNSFSGFAILSNENEIRSNKSERNDDGFLIGGGVRDRNILRNNFAKNNRGNGFLIEDFENIPNSDTFLEMNQAISNDKNGFLIQGLRHKLNHNFAKGNGTEADHGGFVIEGSHFEVFSNTAIRNVGSGFLIKPPFFGPDVITGTQALGNRATRNGQYGILVQEGALDGALLGNVSLRNAIQDLTDENEHCDNNTWQGNRFRTSDPPQGGCIQ